jgi:branched-chain amino acid transport system permease protein
VGEFFNFALPGIPSGCTYALVAVGLVLAFRATGVFNFAFGSEAFAAGVVYTVLTAHGMQPALAGCVVVFVIAPLFGALLDFGLFSRIPPGNMIARIVTSLGIMVVLPQIVTLFTNNETLNGPPPMFFSTDWYVRWGTVVFNGPEMSTFISTIVVLVALTLLLRTRRFGLPIRAAVESPKLLELNGVDSKWVLRNSWMISTSLAGLAGVMFASVSTTVDPYTYEVVVVAAIGAAALGALRSLPLAVLGGVGLGVVTGVVQGYVPTNSVWYTALVPSLPFFMLLTLLIFHKGFRRLQENSDPMAAIEPPPPAPALALRPVRVNRVVRRFRWPLLVVVFLVVLEYVPGPWIAALQIGAALSIIFLSITLMTGIAGQLSLAQAAFAGIGACTAAQLADSQHVPVLVAALAGAVLAGLGGVISAMPALRLRGLPIALLTLCLAVLADNLLFPTSWISGGFYGLVVPRPHLFDINMNAVDSKSFLILLLVILLAVTGAVHALLRGTTGRALSAVHASPVGASGAGVSVRRLTVLLFMLSAAIAGLGGALWSMCYVQETPDDFNWLLGPTFLVIVVTVGVTTVEGALEAGMLYALFNEAVTFLPTRLGSSSAGSSALTILVLSLGAFTYAKHPEGIVEYLKRRVTMLVFRNTTPETDLPPLRPVASEA